MIFRMQTTEMLLIRMHLTEMHQDRTQITRMRQARMQITKTLQETKTTNTKYKVCKMAPENWCHFLTYKI